MTRRRPAASAALVVLVPALLCALAAPPARAQGGATREEAAAGRVVVGAMTGIVGAGAPRAVPSHDVTLRLLVENTGAVPLEDLTVLAEVFAATGSRSALHTAVDDGDPSGLLEDVRAEVRDGAAVDPGEVVPLELVVPGEEVGWEGSGVHPLRVSLLRGRDVLAEVDTAVVHLDRVPGERLATLAAWPLTAPPAAEVGDLATGSRLDRLVRALERAGDLPVQLLVGAAAFEDVAGDTDSLTRLIAATGVRPPAIVAPYADADLAGLVAAGLAEEALQAVAEGRRRYEDTTGARPRPDTLWASAPLTPRALASVIATSRTRTLVLDHAQLAGPQVDALRETPPPLRTLRANGVEMVAAVGDPWLTDLLTDLPRHSGSAVAVQRIVAETAMVHLERPNAPGRGVVLLPPPDWAPDAHTAGELLDRLRRLPWLDVGGLDALLTAVPDRPLAAVQAAPSAFPADLAAAIADARTRVASLQQSLPEPVAEVGGTTWRELDSDLLRAASAWWLPSGADTGRALAAGVAAATREGFGAVSLPHGAVVTLTAETGTLPVTLARTEGGPLRVLVTLEAPPRLRFPEGRSRLITLAPGATRTISLPVTVRGSGRIPVTVRVTAPVGSSDDRAIALGQATLVVRSTAMSGTALAVLGGVLAALFLWWLYRRIRPRRPALHVVRDVAA